MTADFTIEELQIARMSREYRGEVVAVGSTLMAELATKVAKLVHNEDLVINGGGAWTAFDCNVSPSLRHDEFVGRATGRGSYDWSLCFDIIAANKFQIFVGPVQIDRSGATNISVVGDWDHPKVQLIGARGLPDDLWRMDHIDFHMPNQTRRTVVEKVDFVCAFGNGPTRDELGCTTGKPGTLVTNLGVYHWPDGGQMQVQSIHPGVTADEIRANTGFELDIPADIATTEPPSPDELYAIRELVDPFDLRGDGFTRARLLGRRFAQSMVASPRATRRTAQ